MALFLVKFQKILDYLGLLAWLDSIRDEWVDAWGELILLHELHHPPLPEGLGSVSYRSPRSRQVFLAILNGRKVTREILKYSGAIFLEFFPLLSRRDVLWASYAMYLEFVVFNFICNFEVLLFNPF